MTAGDSVAGQIDNGIDLDGVDDEPQAPDDATLRGLGTITLEIWIKHSSLPAAFGNLTAFISKGAPGAFVYALTATTTTPGIGMVLFQSGGSAFLNATVAVTTTDGKFHYIVGTADDSIPEAKVYLDAILKATDSVSSGSYNKNGTSVLQIGTDGDSADANRFMSGVFDEARISNVVRSSDWINASKLSMSDKYITYGPEENLNGFIRQTIEFDENSRRSASQHFLRVIPPKADGTIAARDRRHVHSFYSSSGDTTDFTGKIIEKS